MKRRATKYTSSLFYTQALQNTNSVKMSSWIKADVHLNSYLDCLDKHEDIKEINFDHIADYVYFLTKLRHLAERSLGSDNEYFFKLESTDSKIDELSPKLKVTRRTPLVVEEHYCFLKVDCAVISDEPMVKLT